MQAKCCDRHASVQKLHKSAYQVPKTERLQVLDIDTHMTFLKELSRCQ